MPRHRFVLAPLMAGIALIAHACSDRTSLPPAGTVSTVPSPTISVTALAIASPSAEIFLPGDTLQLTATATLSDGTQQNVTSQTTWRSSEAAVATIAPTGVVSALAGGEAEIQATYAGVSIAAPVRVVGITSLTITGLADRLAVGDSAQLVAIATFSSGLTRDVSASTTWNSLNPAVATISDNGLLRIIGNGAAEVTASYRTVNTQGRVAVRWAAPSIASLDWNDQVGACGGKCAQQGDPILVYCGVATADGGVVDTTLTVTWETGQVWRTTSTSAPGDSALPSRHWSKGSVTGAATQINGDVPGPLRLPAATAVCSSVNADGVGATRSMVIRSQ